MTTGTPDPGTRASMPADLDVDLSLDRISTAATAIDPVFLNSPQYVDEQLSAQLGQRVLTKIETLNPLRSFKGRGADFLISELPQGSTVVCASGGGNFGQAVGYCARRHGLAADVFVGPTTSAVKLQRMTSLGANVHVREGDFQAEAESFAAARSDRIFIADGREAAIAEGAGTIGVELLRSGVSFDTLVLPVGDAALITGVARWIKAHAPGVRIIGVTSAAAPAVMESWRSGQVLTIDQRDTFAAGISIRRPYPEAVRRTHALVDEMVAVENDQIVAAMHLAAETLGVLVEPAGAAGLAAIDAHDISGDIIATVLTGANADPSHYSIR